MVSKEEIKKIYGDAGFGVSEQALGILLKLDNPIEASKQLIELAKKRRFIIAGGDVLTYIVQGKLRTALCTADDMGSK